MQRFAPKYLPQKKKIVKKKKKTKTEQLRQGENVDISKTPKQSSWYKEFVDKEKSKKQIFFT